MLQDYDRLTYLVNKFMEETPAFKHMVEQHMQVVKDQGWDTLYDY